MSSAHDFVIRPLSLNVDCFLLSSKDVRLKGFLDYSPLRGVVLTLSLKKNEHEQVTYESLDTLYGTCPLGSITFLGYVSSSTKYDSDSDIYYFSIIYDFLVFGNYFYDMNNPRIVGVSLCFDYLDYWCGYSFAHSVSGLREDKNSCLFKISCKHPPIEPYDTKNYIMRFSHEYISQQSKDGYFVSPRSFINIYHKQKFDIKDLLNNTIFAFETLLSISTCKKIYLRSARIIVHSDWKDRSFDTFQPICMKIIHYSENKDESDNGYFLRCMDVSSHFTDFIDKWFHICKTYFNALQMYNETIYSESMYSHHVFLNYARVLELIHRISYKGTYLENSIFKNIREHIAGEIGKMLEGRTREVFKDKLMYLNEYTLEDRIVELLKAADVIVEEYISNKDKLIKDIKNTRNYYTHFSKRLEGKALKGEDLNRINTVLRIIIDAIIFTMCGLDSNKFLECRRRTYDIINPLKHNMVCRYELLNKKIY